MRQPINQNFGYAREFFQYKDPDGTIEIYGLCHGPQPGEGAHIENLTVYIYHDCDWFETTNLSDKLVDKYSELLLTKWLEKQR